MPETGLESIGRVPWGTHFCQFYQTKQDLIDVLAPYFREGLLQNELCVWITSEPLEVEEAASALRQALPDLDDRLRAGQIEILDYREWYLASGEFDADRVLAAWVEKERDARRRGYEGLRITGNASWLEHRDWKGIAEYEAAANRGIGDHRMLALCTYSIDKFGVYELIDVVSTHQFALIKRGGQWTVIKSQDEKKTADALRKACDALGLEIQQGTADLGKVIEMLESEVATRMRAEKALQQSERRYRSLILASTEIVWTTDAEGRVVDDMPSWCAFTGQTGQAVRGWGWSDALHPDDRERTKAIWAEAVRSRAPYQAEYRLRRHDGVWRHVVARGISVLEEDGSTREWVGTCVDITERKKNETRLQALHAALQRRAAQLQSLASQLTLTEQRERRRLAQLLHDHLQQLLYAGRLNVSTLRRRVTDKESASIVHQIDAILGKSIEECRSLTIELSPPVLHDAGLAAVLEWLARQIRDNYGLDVELQLDVEAEPKAEDVKVLLFYCVRELLFNVVKHAQARSARVAMTKAPGDQVRIEVMDDGIGLTKDPQLEESADGGFGLFSIRERLGLMGGRLEMHAAPGKGTQVSILAPRDWPVSSDLDTPPSHAHARGDGKSLRKDEHGRSGEKIRILLADDHALFRKGLMEVLNQERDLEVVAEAADGEIAFEHAMRFRPDVVLMDVAMPNVDGIEATRRITDAFAGVSVIGLSAHRQEDMADALYKAGAVSYLSKDEPVESLVSAIRGVASRPSPS